jgi:flagellar protein FlgJ
MMSSSTVQTFLDPVTVPQKKQQAAATAPSDRQKIAARKVAREFEAMFAGMMLKSMRQTVGKDELTGGGHGEEIYRSMLDQEYAKAISEGPGLGLATVIEKELLKTVPSKGEPAQSAEPANVKEEGHHGDR